jgi:hypothetical protein
MTSTIGPPAVQLDGSGVCTLKHSSGVSGLSWCPYDSSLLATTSEEGPVVRQARGLQCNRHSPELVVMQC